MVCKEYFCVVEIYICGWVDELLGVCFGMVKWIGEWCLDFR